MSLDFKSIQPFRLEEEYFILTRNDIIYEIVYDFSGKYNGKGIVLLTSQRLIIIPNENGIGKIGIPLINIYNESFNQPIFGKGFLKGEAKLQNHLEHALFKIWFINNNCGTVIPVFYKLLDSLRSNQFKCHDEHLITAFKGGRFKTVFAIDLKDPSIFFVNQPEAISISKEIKINENNNNNNINKEHENLKKEKFILSSFDYTEPMKYEYIEPKSTFIFNDVIDCTSNINYNSNNESITNITQYNKSNEHNLINNNNNDNDIYYNYSKNNIINEAETNPQKEQNKPSNQPENPPNENIPILSSLPQKRQINTSITSHMLNRRKGGTIRQEKNAKSRLRKSFLYTKPHFSIQAFDQLLLEQRSRKSKSKSKLIVEKLLHEMSKSSKPETSNPQKPKNDNTINATSKEPKDISEVIEIFDPDKTEANISKDNITITTNTVIEKGKSETKNKLPSPTENNFSVKNVNLSITNADISSNTLNISDINPANINKPNNCYTKILPLPKSTIQNRTKFENVNDDTPKTTPSHIRSHTDDPLIPSPSSSKQNNYLSIPKTHQHKKDSLSSLDETSNDDNTPQKISRKIEINPYRNVNTVKKFLVYQIKKYYLSTIATHRTSALIASPKEITTPSSYNNTSHHSHFAQNTSFHEIFTNYSNICSTPGNICKKYEDKNMQINQYYIYKNKKIGKGKHSYVYVCQDLNKSTFYAVKIKNKKYMHNEIQLLKRVHSKYIVTVYEIIDIKNESYIIMELMQNNSLSVNLFELDIFCIWKYFRNLISAVEHCHEIAKIIHQNISLSNCLINDDDLLKLSNFSYGSLLNEDGITIHLTEVPFDKKSFISPPEVSLLIGESDVDGRALDIWLMGNILYTLVMKKSFISSVNKILTIEDYLIEGKITCEDKDLENLLGCLLEPDPEKRYTMDEIKKCKWVTKNNEFPMPDVYEEALDYCYRITSEKIYEKDINNNLQHNMSSGNNNNKK